ncbi:hypothetical protein SKAU_G00186040 [Synaphobranchus kaupii]|uniref:Uncharacterized protein n=1 Tax=Synaphobranchus kaupii TaxID=118154 RepID=A0A9Q1IWZ2_SYNKA|nr:hypothetical protein SKAU_G00186040 [Synaphobranchus kaupii]
MYSSLLVSRHTPRPARPLPPSEDGSIEMPSPSLPGGAGSYSTDSAPTPPPTPRLPSTSWLRMGFEVLTSWIYCFSCLVWLFEVNNVFFELQRIKALFMSGVSCQSEIGSSMTQENGGCGLSLGHCWNAPVATFHYQLLRIHCDVAVLSGSSANPTTCG